MASLVASAQHARGDPCRAHQRQWEHISLQGRLAWNLGLTGRVVWTAVAPWGYAGRAPERAQIP